MATRACLSSASGRWWHGSRCPALSPGAEAAQPPGISAATGISAIRPTPLCPARLQRRPFLRTLRCTWAVLALTVGLAFLAPFILKPVVTMTASYTQFADANCTVAETAFAPNPLSGRSDTCLNAELRGEHIR